MIGAPRGVLPRKATAQSAITRPRKRGSAVSCSVVLPTARKVTLAAPTIASAIRATPTEGAAAAARMARPKTAEAMVRGRSPVRPWPATTRPPTIAPTPIAEVSRPYVPAPPPSGPRASRGSTTWNS